MPLTPQLIFVAHLHVQSVPTGGQLWCRILSKLSKPGSGRRWGARADRGSVAGRKKGPGCAPWWPRWRSCRSSTWTWCCTRWTAAARWRPGPRWTSCWTACGTGRRLSSCWVSSRKERWGSDYPRGYSVNFWRSFACTLSWATCLVVLLSYLCMRNYFYRKCERCPHEDGDNRKQPKKR